MGNMGKKTKRIAAGLFALVLCGGCEFGKMPDPAVPSERTPMRSLPTGSYCLGNSNGVGSWSSTFCESLKCEKKKCVATCLGPATQSLEEGCQVSY